MPVDIDTVVIGAGVVGLAVARRLAISGHETLILDSADIIGSGVSSRNSEVIHAGIYYPQDSLKAKLCVKGRDMLYEFCTSRDVPHNRCGKLIVADSASQYSDISGIAKNAKANGVSDIELLNAEAIKDIEPEVSCIGGLFSPSTGIVDSHSLMLALLGEAEYAGAQLCLSTKVRGISEINNTIVVETEDEQEVYRISCNKLVNAAGLGAVDLVPRKHDENLSKVMAKGNYFRLVGKSPFQRLIYPVPETGGLGIHATIDLQGNARFGPDVQWIDEESYDVNVSSEEDFKTRVSRYWPEIINRDICPDYAGIRPKIATNGEVYPDFFIHDSSIHGVPGLVNLLGIESPGLTSCLAIAEYVDELLS